MKNLVFNIFVFVSFTLLITSCNQENEVSTNTFEKYQLKALEIANQLDLKQVNNKIEERSDSDCWDENSDNCFPFQQTYVVTYQDCDFTVTNDLFICFDNQTGATYFVTGEQTIDAQWFSTPECTSVLYSFVGIWLNGTLEELNDAIDSWEYELEMGWEQMFVAEYISNATSQSYYCGQPEIDANVVIDNYKGTCYQRCFNSDIKGGLVWTDLRCGFGCCRRSSSYCVDRNTGELISDITVIQLEECNYDPEPYIGCDILSPCTDNCSKIK